MKGIGEAVDRKFDFYARCREHSHTYDEYHAMVFLVKDKALPDTLRFYREKCAELGAAGEQIRGITLLIERVERYHCGQADHHEEMA